MRSDKVYCLDVNKRKVGGRVGRQLINKHYDTMHIMIIDTESYDLTQKSQQITMTIYPIWLIGPRLSDVDTKYHGCGAKER